MGRFPKLQWVASMYVYIVSTNWTHWSPEKNTRICTWEGTVLGNHEGNLER